MTDADLLHALKDAFDLKNDAAVAYFLRITRTSIHNIRFKNSRLGQKPKFIILDKIEFPKPSSHNLPWASLLSNHNLSELINSKFNKQIENNNNQSKATELVDIEDSVLIEQVKMAFKYSTDEELARDLGIARNTISAIRGGVTSLGPQPRLRIINIISPFDLDELLKVLTSNTELIAAIKTWAYTE